MADEEPPSPLKMSLVASIKSKLSMDLIRHVVQKQAEKDNNVVELNTAILRTEAYGKIIRYHRKPNIFNEFVRNHFRLI